MAAEPGCQRGGGRSRPQIFKVELKLAATSPVPARRTVCTACRLFALRAAVVGDPWWPQVGCGAVEVFVRCNPACSVLRAPASCEDAGRARHRPALRSASVVVAREGVSAAALACDATLAQQRVHTTSCWPAEAVLVRTRTSAHISHIGMTALMNWAR